jgi:RNA polymerase subunit RPABC4/transcription elongation factor Spt4
MNECPDCGALVAEGHASCPACGAEVREETRSCPRCGETVAAEGNACPACGHFQTPVPCERHRDREARGQCALCGRALCEECDEGRKPYYLCDVHAEVPVIEGWAQVVAIPDEIEARLIEDNLRAEGIEARLLDQKDHSAFVVEFGDLAQVRVLVPTYAYSEAERVIAAHRDAAGEVSFGCPNCGEPYGEEERVCASCGEALV